VHSRQRVHCQAGRDLGTETRHARVFFLFLFFVIGDVKHYTNPENQLPQFDLGANNY